MQLNPWIDRYFVSAGWATQRKANVMKINLAWNSKLHISSNEDRYRGSCSYARHANGTCSAKENNAVKRTGNEDWDFRFTFRFPLFLLKCGSATLKNHMACYFRHGTRSINEQGSLFLFYWVIEPQLCLFRPSQVFVIIWIIAFVLLQCTYTGQDIGTRKYWYVFCIWSFFRYCPRTWAHHRRSQTFADVKPNYIGMSMREGSLLKFYYAK